MPHPVRLLLLHPFSVNQTKGPRECAAGTGNGEGRIGYAIEPEHQIPTITTASFEVRKKVTDDMNGIKEYVNSTRSINSND